MPCPSLLTPCQAERKAQGILEKSLGKEDPRTKDSQHWVQTFLERELKVGGSMQEQGCVCIVRL